MKSKVGIIGKGNVGSALKRGLDRASYEVRIVGNDPKGVAETASWAEIIILAVPFPVIDEVLKEMGGAVNGKTLIDVTNIVTPGAQAALGLKSGAEELQRKAPGAKVVKAFNIIFADHMDKGHVKGEQLTLLVAGDDKDAKAKTFQLARDLGFDTIDAGPLENARFLESLGNLNIQLGYSRGMGRQIGFKLVH